MNRLPLASVLVLALAASACDSVENETPDLDALAAQYAGLAEGTFRLYDNRADSTFAGTAVFYNDAEPPALVLETADFEAGLRRGASLVIESEAFRSASVGAEFEILAGYDSPLSQFGSTDGRARVTAVDESRVTGVFWVRLRDNSTPGFGPRFVVEGGFNAERALD